MERDTELRFIHRALRRVQNAANVKDVSLHTRIKGKLTKVEKETAYTLNAVYGEAPVEFHVMSEDETIGYFVLREMPQCCGICVSTSNYVNGPFRKKGIGTILSRLQKDIATYAGFTVLICTDVATNVGQKKVLNNNGWTDIFRFRNQRTGNPVDISVVSLDPEHEVEYLKGIASCPMTQNTVLQPRSFSRLTKWLCSVSTRS